MNLRVYLNWYWGHSFVHNIAQKGHMDSVNIHLSNVIRKTKKSLFTAHVLSN